MGCILKGGGGLYSRLVVGAVVLAAGEGRRLGSVPKSLIEIIGVPIIKRQLIALSGAGVDELVVVTGYYSEQIEAEIAGFSDHHHQKYRTWKLNPRYILGVRSQRIDRKIRRDRGGALGYATLGTQDYTDLIGAYKKRPDGVNLLRPVIGNRLGNPVIFDSGLLESDETVDKRPLCRRRWTENPDQCFAWQTDNDRYCIDLDTEEDVVNIEYRLGQKLKIPASGVLPFV